ncbi:RimK family alpha-L-glutamate ligase [Ignisphaera sp. 4213-co]|uniref:RimK family alpha-L-glutamate ligase n=1 Tax=Ignisphaera cupida TaxID=3050454 RepID=A0ABD4Z641_9CREN|nr:RimK family alpha-L-glutamate ligase [Ignisphaera sp. 4213-co]MDK6028781.1 RimK family alpha-L-glutamate ligase [Ignisphaera sp. 4213-co]
MEIGIITRNPRSWSSSHLIEAFQSFGCSVHTFRFSDVVAHIDVDKPKFYVNNINIVDRLSAVVVRPFGRVSLDQAIFRIDILYALQELGLPVFNKPSAIEKCVDKFRSLYTLKMHGVPVPRTIATERSSLAMRSVEMLKSKDVVFKPMFGSRGHGSTRIRIRDRDVLWDVVRSVTFVRHVAYLQEFLPHGGEDIRVFVLGERVLAAMYRRAPPTEWKTNIARGGKAVKIEKLDSDVENIAIKAAKILECEIAGVDIVRLPDSLYVLEVNSQPGWRGLQEAHPEIDIAKEIAKYVIEKARR